MTTGGPPGGISREDELLSRLYQQVTEQQAARFGGGYDIAAGLDRYRTWLRDHAAWEHARPASGPAGIGIEIPGAGADRDADEAVAALYSAYYRPLVRLAVLLVHDIPTAEDVVQDSFIALHAGFRRLRDSDKALAYLRIAVVNRSRSVLRHRIVVDRPAPGIAPEVPSAEPEQLALIERSAMVSALRALPARQREALVLRYYAGLSEAQIASTMGITRGAVKSHTARAMSSLSDELRRTDE